MLKTNSMLDGLEKHVSRWTMGLAIISVAVFIFLSLHHAFDAMWVEGFHEYERLLLILAGLELPGPADCLLHSGNLSFPIGLDAYTGATPIYLDAPAALVWFNGWTTDPYVYRYTGIFVLLVESWLLYFTLKHYYPASISFYGAAAFLTTPNLLLLTLTERWFFLHMVLFILGEALLFSHYIKGGSDLFLLLSAVVLGVTLTTRPEAFIWPMVPFVLYLAIIRPPQVLNRWAQTKHTLLVTLTAVGGFILGASSLIVYNVVCPRDNIFSFVRAQIVPNLLSGTSGSLSTKFITRITQFWSFSLLNRWAFFELHTPNYLFVVLWILAAAILLVRWIRRREPSLLLLMTLTSIPLSLIVSSGLREEHLVILQPLFILVITAGLAHLEKVQSFGRQLMHIAFSLLLLSGIVTCAVDWRDWNAQPATTQTMLNQSDPVLLVEALSRDHAQDRILYTNIGIPQYVQYTSVNQIKGEDIINWFSVEGFTNDVKLALLDKDRRRVFVAVSPERDGRLDAGTLPRTKLLYGLLDRNKIPYTTTKISSDRNKYLYDLILVDKGVTLQNETIQILTIFVSSVGLNPITNNRIEGTIYGSGFLPGDEAIIDESLVALTAFGNTTYITFAISQDSLKNPTFFKLEIFRPGTMELSQPYIVNLPTPNIKAP